RCFHSANGYVGTLGDINYPVNDDRAAYFSALWTTHGEAAIVSAVLSDRELWGEDLSLLPGFAPRVNHYLTSIVNNGARATLRRFATSIEATMQ
ncbi:MAG TPA: hypothetical protein VGC95_05075, partial [Chitinophagaceae bacterium]